MRKVLKLLENPYSEDTALTDAPASTSDAAAASGKSLGNFSVTNVCNRRHRADSQLVLINGSQQRCPF